MGENPRSSQPPSNDGLPTSLSRWVNPRAGPPPSSLPPAAPLVGPLSTSDNSRCPPTAMMKPSGGLAGGVRSVKTPCPLHPSYRRFLHRHPPVPTTSTDPYFIRGGLQPFTAEDISDDEADLSYLCIRCAVGGVEKVGPEEGVEKVGSEEVDDSYCSISQTSAPPSFPIDTDDLDLWNKCVAEADVYVEDMMRKCETKRKRK